jgi:hypothetical protein
MAGKVHAYDSIDKVIFVCDAASAAKELVVKDAGIGEDLTFGLYGWKDNYLTVLLQMKPEHMWADKQERFSKLTKAACILRQGWGIDEFTLVAEGYCSTDPDATRGVPLQQAFVSMDAVRECLTFTHVNENETSIVTRPYKFGWPRKVEFQEDMYFPGQSILRRKDAGIPAMLLRVIERIEPEELPVDVDEFHNTLGEGLYEQGFLAQWF